MLAVGTQHASPPQLLSAQDEADLRLILRKLTKCIPAAFPVELRFVKTIIADGWCCRDPDKFQIMVSRYLSRGQSIYVLLHEYAHAFSWNHLEDKWGNDWDVSEEQFEHLSHGPAWGVALSHVYQTYITKIRRHIQMPWPVETDGDRIVSRKGAKA